MQIELQLLCHLARGRCIAHCKQESLPQDDQPRAFPVSPSTRSAGSLDSPTGLKKREAGVALAANFTANNRSGGATAIGWVGEWAGTRGVASGLPQLESVDVRKLSSLC